MGKIRTTTDNALEAVAGRVTVNSVSWRPVDRMACEEWLRHGERLGTIGRASAWWIGDWVNYGNTKFGEKYSRAARITGYDVKSLMNMAYVASSFPVERRHAGLSWSHHAELAPLDAEDQDRWLTHADELRLSVQGLREALRTERRKSAPAGEHAVRREGGCGPSLDGTPAESLCPNCGFDLAGDAAHPRASAQDLHPRNSSGSSHAAAS